MLMPARVTQCLEILATGMAGSAVATWWLVIEVRNLVLSSAADAPRLRAGGPVSLRAQECRCWWPADAADRSGVSGSDRRQTGFRIHCRASHTARHSATVVMSLTPDQVGCGVAVKVDAAYFAVDSRPGSSSAFVMYRVTATGWWIVRPGRLCDANSF